MKFGKWIVPLLVMVMGASSGRTLAQSGVPDSLNVPKAKAAYDEQRRLADIEKRAYESEAARYREVESRYQSAVRDENSARADLKRAQDRLAELDSQVYSLQREIPQLQSKIDSDRRELANHQDEESDLQRDINDLERKRTNVENEIRDIQRRIDSLSSGDNGEPYRCCARDSGWEEHGPHCALDRNRNTAQDSAMATCKSMHGSCSSLGCEQQDSSEVARLRQQLESKISERDRLDRDIQSKRNDLDSVRREVRDIQYRLDDNQRLLGQKQSELSYAIRDRDNQHNVIANASDRLRRASDEVARTRRDLNVAASSLASAKSDWDSAEASASSAWRSYQTVLANYNAELDKVFAAADAAGDTHGRREAEGRAVSAGKAEGVAEGRALGTEKGLAEARERDHVRGLLSGRRLGSTEARLAVSYADGMSLGTAKALEKAASEEMPRGYNLDLRDALAVAPAQEETIDMANAPVEGTQAGEFMTSNAKPVITVNEPTFVYPAEPGYQVPAVPAINTHTPSALLTFNAAPCSNLVLEEFGSKCVARYEAAYRSRFGVHYDSIFKEAYRPEFESAVKVAYDDSLAPQQALVFAAAELVGAKDQGVLDGFARTLPQAKLDQFQAGKKLFGETLNKSSLVVLRSVGFGDQDGDGLSSPGETLRLKLVVDNYGGMPTAADLLRVKITKVDGLGQLSVEERILPALAPRTRSTLVGVVTGVPVGTAAGTKFFVEADLIATPAGQASQVVASFKAEGTTRFPLEMTKLDVTGKIFLDRSVKATLDILNNLPKASGPLEVTLKSARSGVLTFSGMPLKLANLEPQATGSLQADLKGSAWIGPETDVEVVATVKSADGKTTSQSFVKKFEIQRNASLGLRTSTGQPAPSAQFTVQAGSRLMFQVPFLFQATQYKPGPFEVKHANKSDPAIGHCPNTTIGVNYGGVSPGTSSSATLFCYDIPKSMAGKDGWVVISLTEGGTAIHLLPVYFKVK